MKFATVAGQSIGSGCHLCDPESCALNAGIAAWQRFLHFLPPSDLLDVLDARHEMPQQVLDAVLERRGRGRAT